jgi:hypothetical protein
VEPASVSRIEAKKHPAMLRLYGGFFRRLHPDGIIGKDRGTTRLRIP